ncbi:MYXO-CTERM domain-containing protein [Prauserella isguenensis]|uniref:MYXO-CTERM domain-containing protein n=1 Tax=Prauserella isguenensis TaxID=1470180 RepID=A0A839S344_9PSEU|nr:phosphatase PAP2 family protein [Prauserella isguenensis]MBB3051179.1 MYXO-CTERM domain-containing protein [Prauserella isguenensis]
MPVALACTLVLLGTTFVVTGAVVAGGHGPVGPDPAVAAFAGRFDEDALTVFVLPTEPPVWLTALALLTAASLWRRRWDVAATAVGAPTAAIALATWVAKPLFDRWYDDHLAYPSGHTTALVSTLTVLVLTSPPAWRRGLTVAAAAVSVLAGLGLVGLDYHYATDVVGGAALAVAVTLVVARLASRARPAPTPRRPAPER